MRAHDLDLAHRDAAGDARQILGEGQPVDQLLALAEAGRRSRSRSAQPCIARSAAT